MISNVHEINYKFLLDEIVFEHKCDNNKLIKCNLTVLNNNLLSKLIQIIFGSKNILSVEIINLQHVYKVSMYHLKKYLAKEAAHVSQKDKKRWIEDCLQSVRQGIPLDVAINCQATDSHLSECIPLSIKSKKNLTKKLRFESSKNRRSFPLKKNELSELFNQKIDYLKSKNAILSGTKFRYPIRRKSSNIINYLKTILNKSTNLLCKVDRKKIIISRLERLFDVYNRLKKLVVINVFVYYNKYKYKDILNRLDQLVCMYVYRFYKEHPELDKKETINSIKLVALIAALKTYVDRAPRNKDLIENIFYQNNEVKPLNLKKILMEMELAFLFEMDWRTMDLDEEHKEFNLSILNE